MNPQQRYVATLSCYLCSRITTVEAASMAELPRVPICPVEGCRGGLYVSDVRQVLPVELFAWDADDEKPHRGRPRKAPQHAV